MTLHRKSLQKVSLICCTVVVSLSVGHTNANEDFTLKTQVDPGNQSVADAIVSVYPPPPAPPLSDNVSISWSIYDGNDVLVGTGWYPTSGTLPVPPGFTEQIQCPTSNPPYTVDVVGYGDKHNHPSNVGGVTYCGLFTMSRTIGKDKAAAPLLHAPTGTYQLHVAPALHVHGTTRWHVPVSVTPLSGWDTVKLMYFAFYTDSKTKVRTYLHCFPRNGGTHYVDYDNNLTFSEEVLLEIPKTVTLPVTFGVSAKDGPFTPQDPTQLQAIQIPPS